MFRKTILAALAAVVLGAGAAPAQTSLYYREIARDGKVYVFNTPEKLAQFEKSGEFGTNVTMVNQGPNGETVVAENETALDLYNFKHDRPGYERPAPKPEKVSPPTTLKIGSQGEVKLGLLAQGWYISDTSSAGSGSSLLGNNRGNNTFRLRRAEISLSGKITPDWGFLVMFDPAKGITPQTGGTDGKVLQDFAVSYLGIAHNEIAIGQKKIALTEEGIHSSSDIDFIERALMTKTFSDRRETGLFYSGSYGDTVGATVSLTQGTASNTLDDSNDTLFLAGRLDVKPVKGLLIGASGGTSGGETAAHLERTRYGAHVRWDGPAEMPIGFRAEYMRGKDGNANGTTLNRDGWYASALYTAAQHYQFGVRYDEFNANKDVGNFKTKTFTAGFHYLVYPYAQNSTTSRNVNIKLDYYNIKDETRTVDDSYGQFVLAAQIAF